MIRSGRRAVMTTAAFTTSVFLLATAGAARGDDLTGYSVDATYTTQTQTGAVLLGELPRHGPGSVSHHDRIYVSLRGNVFDYSDVSGGFFASHGGNETHLDRAKPISRQREQAWTIESGRLLRVQKGIEGILVATFTIDPGKSTCIVSWGVQPDPKTGRTVFQLLNGATAEIKGYIVSNPTCTVRHGNIFASDQ